MSKILQYYEKVQKKRKTIRHCCKIKSIFFYRNKILFIKHSKYSCSEYFWEEYFKVRYSEYYPRPQRCNSGPEQSAHRGRTAAACV